MLQDSRTARTNTTSGTGTAGVSRTLTRRMTGNGCSRRSERKYEIGSATDFFMNDFDDERTLDEEEAMEGSEDSHNELSNLQKERDMPLKELLAKYGYSHTSTDNSNSSDQLVLLREGEEPGSGLASEKPGENDGDDFEDEEEDDEDEDDGDDDEDEDDDEDDRTVRKKIGSKSQPSLRQFYTEMVKEEEAERLNTTGNNKSTSVNQSKKSEDDHNDDVFDMSYGEVGRDTTGNLVSGQSGDGPAPGINSDVGNNTHNNGENNSGTGRRRDEDDDDDDEDDEEDDDEDGDGAGVVGNTGTSGVGSGNVSGGSSRLLRSVSRPQSEEEDDDCDYSPDEEEWKKTIMVGSDYQATIPEGLCRYDDALPYENEDKILWNPSYIPEEETEEFLERAQLPTNKVNALPAGAHIRDDEQALYLLLQCGYNLEEALRRRRMNVLPPTDAISLWSEEECHNFESGLRTYGKDFHLIQKNKVRTRSVGELVQFYYLWKKTERHDIFTYKARLEKKKYALHPGITDYMDRFLEEQEGVRDRSSSPNVNCLILGDVKRQRTSTNMTNNHAEGGKSTESWDGTANEDPLGDLNNAENLTSTVTSPSSSLLPPPAPPSVPFAPTTTPPSSTSPSLTTSSNLAQTNSTPTVSQNHEPVSHDYTPTSDNVLSNLPP